MTYTHVRFASWRWMIAATLAAVLSIATGMAFQAQGGLGAALPSISAGANGAGASSQTGSPLARIASSNPAKRVEVIVQLTPGTDAAAGRSLVQAAGGKVTRELPIINGLSTTLSAGAAQRLGSDPAVHAVSLNAEIQSQGQGHGHDGDDDGRFNAEALATSYNQSIRTDKVWDEGYTGRGVGVALIDTGIAGSKPDFRVSQSNSTSRVIASAVVNPDATTADDSFGHGTHVAGLIAGNGANRPSDDPLNGSYVGAAPDANLIAVKVADEQGNATVLDVIEGLQFVVDHKSDYNIRVANLSLRSTVSESYLTDPLDAAVEATWNSGVVVVTAAGNLGRASDAVSYAPANDPYVITVGGVDDQGTKNVSDDSLASWSSRGTTQDGYVKPDVLAPGAHLVSTIPSESVYTQLCPTCIVDGGYFRVGGTSMAAGLVSGEVADLLQARPGLSPNQVKAQVVRRTRGVKYATYSADTLVDSSGAALPGDVTVKTNVIGGEIQADKAIDSALAKVPANAGLTPSTLLDPATGQIDYSRASWSRASWSEAVDPLRASWSRASWSRASWSRASWSATPENCLELERASWSRASWSVADMSSAQADCATLLATIEPTRASWSAWAEADPDRASWSRASWSRASWSRASWSTGFDK